MDINRIDSPGIKPSLTAGQSELKKPESGKTNASDSLHHDLNRAPDTVDVGKTADALSEKISPWNFDVKKAADMLTKKTESWNIEELWVNSPESNNMFYEYGAPVLCAGPDGTVCGITGKNNGFMMEKDSGELRWKIPIGTTRFEAPAVTETGIVVYAVDERKGSSLNTTVKAIDSNTGKEVWNATIPEFVCSSPKVGDNGKIYISTQGNDKPETGGLKGLFSAKPLAGALIELDSQTGKQQWRCSIGDKITHSPAHGADGKTFTGTLEEHACAVDKDGKIIWDKHLPARGSYKNTSEPAVGKDGTLFIHVSNTELFALNPDTGEKKWSFKCDTVQDFHGVTVDDNGNAIIGGKDGVLHALDGNTGQELWHQTFEGKNHALVTVMPEGKIAVVGRDSSNLFILDSKTGLEVGNIDLKGKINQALVASKDGTLYVSTGDGAVHALKLDNRPLSEKLSKDTPQNTDGKSPDGKIEISEQQVIIGGVKLPRKKNG
jgi:outer membrane protein assembly factor BamB